MKKISMRVSLVLLVLLVVASSLFMAPTLAGKKKGLKGRYLELDPGVSLGKYRGAIVVLEPAEIVSDKDRPVDTESVRITSGETLREALTGTELFHRLVAAIPAERPEGVPVVTLKTKLTLQHGSSAKRFFIGFGAGKSKLHIRIDIVDALTGEHLAFYNGYGTGAGLWSFSGGGVQRMARDDFQENYGHFAQLLGAQM